jgi:hypothetical protein
MTEGKWDFLSNKRPTGIKGIKISVASHEHVFSKPGNPKIYFGT